MAHHEALAKDVKDGKFKDMLLLGMGGSSLGPEVFAETFGSKPGFPKLHVLDSTDPAQVKRFEEAVDLKSCLFLVSSKSGSTLEPNIFKAYFFEKAKEAVGEAEAAKRFLAVTDPNSTVEKMAREAGFRHIFHGLEDHRRAAIRCCRISAWCRRPASASRRGNSSRHGRDGAFLRAELAAVGEPRA